MVYVKNKIFLVSKGQNISNYYENNFGHVVVWFVIGNIKIKRGHNNMQSFLLQDQYTNSDLCIFLVTGNIAYFESYVFSSIAEYWKEFICSEF